MWAIMIMQIVTFGLFVQRGTLNPIGSWDDLARLEHGSQMEWLLLEAFWLPILVYSESTLMYKLLYILYRSTWYSCCTVSEAAVLISYTGKIWIRLTASIPNYTTLPCTLAMIMFCGTWLHTVMTRWGAWVLSHRKPLIRNFIVSGNGILGKLTNNFGCKSRAPTICLYTSYLCTDCNFSKVYDWLSVAFSHPGLCFLLRNDRCPPTRNSQYISSHQPSKPHCKHGLYYANLCYMMFMN